MGRGKVREVLGESNLIEVAEVIFISFLGFEDSAVLHVVQGQTSGIGKFGFLTGIHIITNHHIMLLPFSVALTDHVIMPLTEVPVQKLGILALLNFPFLLSILVVQVRQ